MKDTESATGRTGLGAIFSCCLSAPRPRKGAKAEGNYHVEESFQFRQAQRTTVARASAEVLHDLEHGRTQSISPKTIASLRLALLRSPEGAVSDHVPVDGELERMLDRAGLGEEVPVTSKRLPMRTVTRRLSGNIDAEKERQPRIISHGEKGWSEGPFGSLESKPAEDARWGKVESELFERVGFDRWRFFPDDFADGVDKPLSCFTGLALETLGLINSLHLPRPTVERFLDAVNDSYAPPSPKESRDSRRSLSLMGFDYVPYHNLPHAVDVTQCLYMILREGKLREVVQLDDEEALAAIVAAAVHDMDHEGFTNEFYARMQDARALLYGMETANEKHHVASCLLLLNMPEFDMLSSLSGRSRARVCSMLSNIVYATNLKVHFDVMKEFDEMMNQGPDFASDERARLLALKLAIKVADIAHATHDEMQHRRWTDRLEAEMWRQGDIEKRTGLPLSQFADRYNPGMRAGQTGFMDVIVLPMLRSFTSLLPACTPLLEGALANYEIWRKGVPEDEESS